jgi:hypothetical protein
MKIPSTPTAILLCDCFNHIRSSSCYASVWSVVAKNVTSRTVLAYCCIVGIPEIHDHVLVAKHSAAIGYHYVIIVTIHLLHGMFHAFRTHKLSFFRFTTLLYWLQPRPNQSALLETQEFAAHPHIEPLCIFIRMNISYGRNSKVSDTFLRNFNAFSPIPEKLSILERLATNP